MLHIHYVIEQEVSQHLKLLLNLVCQLKRVSNVPLGHEKEVVVTDGPFRHGDVEVLRFRVDDQVSIDAGVLEAEPAVLVLLDSDALHLEVNAE